ncbi:methyltransferase domain-containing protein [Streptomyces sp. NPDC054933]
MTVRSEKEQAAVSGLLHAVEAELGHPLAEHWRRAAEACPRHTFLPETIWTGVPLKPCRRVDDPDAWFATAYANTPVITQVNDGEEPEDDPWPSSSASAPGIVFRMLEDLAPEEGQRVLEVGAGTGFNACLLAHYLGDENVVTVELDQQVAAHAREALARAGSKVLVVRADGADGWMPRAPYDRIIATCSVREIPVAWLKQAAPGGRILTPWDNPWVNYGLLNLAVTDGAAQGRFSPWACFMLMRGQRTNLRLHRDVVRDDHQPDESTTSLDPDLVTDENWDTQFAIGMRLSNVWASWDHAPGISGVASRLWLAATDGTSWAAVDWDGDDNTDHYTVHQHGSRRLWDETESAYHWWQDAGEPGPDRFGITVTADGTHTTWLDEPGNTLSTS